MTILMRIGQQDIKLRGQLVLGKPVIRLTSTGNLEASELYTTLIATDTTAQVDDARSLDTSTTHDDTMTTEDFLATFFGLVTSNVPPNMAVFIGNKIVTNAVTENQNLV